MESTNEIDFISHSEKDIENVREINSILNVDFDEVIEVLESQNIIKNEVAAICNNIQEGSFPCTACEKKCKSKSGLTRHFNNKHGSTTAAKIYSFSRAAVADHLAKCVEKLKNSDLYSKETKQHALEFSISAEQLSILADEINTIKVKTTEKFQTKFFCQILANAERFIASSGNCFAAILLPDLCTSLIGEHNKKVEENMEQLSSARIITERERAGLQYLGGYILRNVFYSLKKSADGKKGRMHNCMTAVKAMKNEEKPINQKLISALDRNGLWYISQEFEEILVLAEKVFCHEVKSRSDIRIINQADICAKIISTPKVTQLFKFGLEASEVDISDHECKDVLHSLLKLFVQVRSSNIAKDVVQKSKLKLAADRNVKKSLRQNLKVCSNDLADM